MHYPARVHNNRASGSAASSSTEASNSKEPTELHYPGQVAYLETTQQGGCWVSTGGPWTLWAAPAPDRAPESSAGSDALTCRGPPMLPDAGSAGQGTAVLGLGRGNYLSWSCPSPRLRAANPILESHTPQGRWPKWDPFCVSGTPHCP